MNVSAESRQRFLREYAHIRHAEGRGSADSEYYRALPFRDVSGRNAAMWAIRAKTYKAFLDSVLTPIERAVGRALDILDLGAGNCWLSYQLAVRGHRPVAVDIFTDEQDGLGAARHYSVPFGTREADFDDLPFASETFDLAIFNAALHYSTGYVQTLREVRRCLRPSGTVVILDSPIYRKREQGLRMVEEKRAHFTKQYGFASDALPSMEFLDLPTLKELSCEVGIEWTIHRPWYGWRWHTRRIRAALNGRRPPSRFWILVGHFRAI